jgi:hypothetical protein
VDLCTAVGGWPNVSLDGVGVANIFGGWENVCRDGVGVGAILCGGGSDRTDASFGAISGNGVGVGVGVGDCDDRARLYLIWLNAIEATNNDATVETTIRVIIKRFNLGLV